MTHNGVGLLSEMLTRRLEGALGPYLKLGLNKGEPGAPYLGIPNTEDKVMWGLFLLLSILVAPRERMLCIYGW